MTNRVSRKKAVRQKKQEKLVRKVWMGSFIIRACVNLYQAIITLFTN